MVENFKIRKGAILFTGLFEELRAGLEVAERSLSKAHLVHERWQTPRRRPNSPSPSKEAEVGRARAGERRIFPLNQRLTSSFILSLFFLARHASSSPSLIAMSRMSRTMPVTRENDAFGRTGAPVCGKNEWLVTWEVPG
jgi:hypothetical protein